MVSQIVVCWMAVVTSLVGQATIVQPFCNLTFHNQKSIFSSFNCLSAKCKGCSYMTGFMVSSESTVSQLISPALNVPLSLDRSMVVPSQLSFPTRPRQLLECSDLFTEMLRRRQPFNERDAREEWVEMGIFLDLQFGDWAVELHKKTNECVTV